MLSVDTCGGGESFFALRRRRGDREERGDHRQVKDSSFASNVRTHIATTIEAADEESPKAATHPQEIGSRRSGRSARTQEDRIEAFLTTPRRSSEGHAGKPLDLGVIRWCRPERQAPSGSEWSFDLQNCSAYAGGFPDVITPWPALGDPPIRTDRPVILSAVRDLPGFC